MTLRHIYGLFVRAHAADINEHDPREILQAFTGCTSTSAREGGHSVVSIFPT